MNRGIAAGSCVRIPQPDLTGDGIVLIKAEIHLCDRIPAILQGVFQRDISQTDDRGNMDRDLRVQLVIHQSIFHDPAVAGFFIQVVGIGFPQVKGHVPIRKRQGRDPAAYPAGQMGIQPVKGESQGISFIWIRSITCRSIRNMPVPSPVTRMTAALEALSKGRRDGGNMKF